jgi:SAM-dependent methyltransferase
MKENADLRGLYESIYRKGEREHYTPLLLQPGSVPEAFVAVLALVDWTGKRVVDVGCGTGDMCWLVANAGARAVVGIDYAEAAIDEAIRKHAAPNLTFICGDVKDIEGNFDVIVSNGTLEHMDSPFATLQMLKGLLNPGGSLILTCPNWLNPRGYMLQVLWHFFRAPITLADLHYLGPLDFVDWAKELDMDLQWFTVDHDWGSGMKMVDDFKRRLPNVARDAGWAIPGERLEEFLSWLERRVVPFRSEGLHEGAVGVYHLRLR